MQRPLCQARFAHQHPAWHIVNRQQIDRIVMESLDALLKPRDAVRDTLAPFSLELVRGDEHLETFTLFLCGRCCPSSAPTVSVLWATAHGQSSPNQLVVLLPSSHQPVALQRTS